MDPWMFPQTREWSERVGGWDLRQYLVNNIQVSDATAMGALFWPGFIEHSGAVLVDFLFNEASYVEWFAQTGEDVHAVEKMLNHLHLWDVFDPKSDNEYSALSDLSQKIAGTWVMAAKTAFPGRQFRTEISDTPTDYGPSVTLYSI